MKVITLARKPFEGTGANNVLTRGCGGINIDGARIAAPNETITTHTKSNEAAKGKGIFGAYGGFKTHQTPGQKLGRFPSNTIFQHRPECVCLGAQRVAGRSSCKTSSLGQGRNVPVTSGIYGAKNSFIGVAHVDADGTEIINAWECVDGCPVKALDDQSGVLTSGKMAQEVKGNQFNVYGKMYDRYVETHGDSGGASRFFKQVKP